MKKNNFNFNDLYMSLFENNKSVFLLIELNSGRIIHANQSACEYYGYNYDELIMLNIQNINILSEIEIKAEMEKASLEKRNSFNFIHRLANNELRNVEVISNPIKINNQDYLFSIVTDVNEKLSNQLMINDLFYDAPSAMAIIDNKLNIITINKRFTQLFGYDLREVRNKPLNKLIGNNELDPDINVNFTKVLQGELVNKDTVRQTKNHHLIDVNIIATPYQIGTEISGALLVYTDITAQLKIKKEIEESKDQLQLLLDSTVEAIYGIDIHGICTFCNASGLKMLGYPNQKELLGKNMHLQIHHTYKNGRPMPLEECKIHKALQEGNGVHVDDEVFWRSDGSCFEVEYHSYPQKKAGQVIGAVVTFFDNTERKVNL